MKQMTSVEIRNAFLDFFRSKDHMIEQGHSLVPTDDPTLLWINSGVAALKKYFDGTIKPENNKIANVQKAIRSNDIENVGKTARHHTFFEMLGNFSIGSYFKREAIHYAWEFLTSEKWMGLDIDKLYVTIHPSDDQAYDIWVNEIGIDPSRIAKHEGNFWQIGEGPSGPNSEIFFDRGEAFDPEKRGLELFFNDEDNDRYIEVWNIVFSQYNAVEGVPREQFKELPQKNIDTGMGFERLVNIVQGGETNFDTDLFLPIIEATSIYTDISYQDNKIAYRVIADHIRTVTFALADGALFSNEGRGYVLRRIIRRAIRYGKQLNIKGPFMYQLVDVVCEVMADFYGYVAEKKELIKKLVKQEEERFEQTLNEGERLLSNLLENATVKQLKGQDVFKLYDTYGFPYELTLEVALENGFSVDEEGFKAAMAHQKELSRSSRAQIESFSSQNEELMNFNEKFSFIGYDQTVCEAKVVGLFKEGKSVDSLEGSGLVILDQSVFYGESGGQVGDKGILYNDGFSASVTNVVKAPNKQHLHTIENVNGILSIGDVITAKVDELERNLIKRNHTSVHLLQSALLEVLGSHIAQAGSYVCKDYARFDFNHFEKVTANQLKNIESMVNNWIVEGHPVTIEHMSLPEAKAQGAIGLFEDKYGDVVRVVSVGDFSKELCGGTHVNNSSELGLFVIESEESVGSGIRRITMRTSKNAYAYLMADKEQLIELTNLIQVNSTAKLNQKVIQMNQEISDLNKQLDELNHTMMLSEVKSLDPLMKDNVLVFDSTINSKLVKPFMDLLKQKYPDAFIFGVFNQGDKLNLASVSSKSFIEKGIKAGDLVKEAAMLADGKGGGKPDFAQAGAKDVSKINEIKTFILEKVS